MSNLGVGQIAEMTGVARRTVTKWIDGGHLKGHRLPGSGHRRVTTADFLAFVRKHEIPVEIEGDTDGPANSNGDGDAPDAA